ncbi:MAG: hypothetical protein WCG45_04455 [bacterium]
MKTKIDKEYLYRFYSVVGWFFTNYSPKSDAEVDTAEIKYYTILGCYIYTVFLYSQKKLY